jgi:hypothetical protein
MRERLQLEFLKLFNSGTVPFASDRPTHQQWCCSMRFQTTVAAITTAATAALILSSYFELIDAVQVRDIKEEFSF